MNSNAAFSNCGIKLKKFQNICNAVVSDCGIHSSKSWYQSLTRRVQSRIGLDVLAWYRPIRENNIIKSFKNYKNII